jgi:hypothetical protein
MIKLKDILNKVLNENETIDQLLDKISAYGIKSLSQQELDILNNFSKGKDITNLNKDEEYTLDKIFDKAGTQGWSNLSFLERDWLENNFPIKLRDYDTLYLSDPTRRFLKNNKSTKGFYDVKKYIDDKVSQAKQTNNLQNLTNSGYFENNIEEELIDWYNEKYNEKIKYIGNDIKNYLKKIYNQEFNTFNIVYSKNNGEYIIDEKNLYKLLKKHFSLNELKDELVDDFVTAIYDSGVDLFTEMSEREWIEEYSTFLEDYKT